MARIPYPDPASQSPEVRDRLQRLGSLNVTRMMSHAEGVMTAYSKLGTQLLLRGTLDPVLRECVILRVGQLCRSDYEWYQHVSVARAVGMPQAMLDAIAAERFADLPDAHRLAIGFAEEIHGEGAVSPATFAEGRALFSEAQLVELCILIGHYIMTAGFLRSFEIEAEDTPPLGASLRK
ncbi:MAG: carboxymuconolactone decarboxylase family protein [Sphingobium sp.]